MATYEISPANGAGAKLPRPVELVCFALLVMNVVYLGAAWAQGSWAIGTDGSKIFNDFVTIWAAGKMALAGHAAQAYDWVQLKPVDESIVGPVSGYLVWPYPPTFLLAAAALALLPYVTAFFVWVFGTFIAYLTIIRAIIGDRVGYFLAAGFPAVIANALVGQTAFLSTALIGGALVFMDTQPIWAGLLLGLLTYKPHLGLLFPIALAVSGRWRVFFTAGIVAALLAAVSWAVFGSESWVAFASGISHSLVSDGSADWGKMQTASGLVRLAAATLWPGAYRSALQLLPQPQLPWSGGAASRTRSRQLRSASPH
jgi:arabinofuranan 3-O-arabinosyltransferase